MPEKNIQSISRNIRDQHEKGVTALQRQNFDYAISILSAVLELEPAFFECRQALRAAQFKKMGQGSGFFKKMMGGASLSPLIAKGQLALRRNPIEALPVAEQILSNDPNSAQGHKLIVEAATAADLPKTAVLSLEILAKNSPKDADISRQLAQAYSVTGQVDKAETVYRDLIRQNPNDSELMQEYKNLSAQKTMSEGGYEMISSGGGSYRDIIRDKQQAAGLEEEARSVKNESVTSRLIREYEERRIAEPKNLKVLRSLAELYTQQNEFDRALENYNAILELEGGDPSLERAVSETISRKFDYLVSKLDPASPTYAEESARLTAERDINALQEAKKRADKYPSDLQIRFELGQLYFKAGKLTEAIQEFQKAQNNPHRRTQAMSYLGQAFARRGMNDLAARTLQTAIREKIVFDEEKKELIYALGCVLEKMAKREEAIEQFKQIYEIDIGYRDVAQKVDDYYAGQ